MQGLRYHITRSEEQQGHDRLNKEQPGPGRGDNGWAATRLHLNMSTSNSGVRTAEVNVAGDRLPPGPGKSPIE